MEDRLVLEDTGRFLGDRFCPPFWYTEDLLALVLAPGGDFSAAGILNLAISALAAFDWYIEDLLVVLLTGEGDFGENILSLPEIHPGDVVTFLATTADLKHT